MYCSIVIRTTVKKSGLVIDFSITERAGGGRENKVREGEKYIFLRFIFSIVSLCDSSLCRDRQETWGESDV